MLNGDLIASGYTGIYCLVKFFSRLVGQTTASSHDPNKTLTSAVYSVVISPTEQVVTI